jgi:hypothetical protein
MFIKIVRKYCTPDLFLLQTQGMIRDTLRTYFCNLWFPYQSVTPSGCMNRPRRNLSHKARSSVDSLSSTSFLQLLHFESLVFLGRELLSLINKAFCNMMFIVTPLALRASQFFCLQVKSFSFILSVPFVLFLFSCMNVANSGDWMESSKLILNPPFLFSSKFCACSSVCTDLSEDGVQNRDQYPCKWYNE